MVVARVTRHLVPVAAFALATGTSFALADEPFVGLDDPLFTNAWHLNNTGQLDGVAGVDMNILGAWPLSRGEGQLIAIVDTGIDLDHPDLEIAAGFDFGSDDSDPGPDLVDDDYPHGTSMAGVAAGRGDNGLGIAGVAPSATVLPVKIVGRAASPATAARAIDYAVNRGAGVISNAWGFTGPDCEPVALAESLAEAIDYAETRGRDGLGAVVVFSAGNGGCDLALNELLADDRLVVVGAHDDRGLRRPYSNTGDALDLLGPSGALDGAGGLWTTDVQGVLGYDNGSDYWHRATGTSAAASAVSGVFALMFAVNPELTAEEARQIACETAVRDAPDASWDAHGRSRSYGCGRIDAAAAVAAAADRAPPETAPDTSDAGGCRVAQAPSAPPGSAVIAMLALGLVGRRRRGAARH